MSMHNPYQVVMAVCVWISLIVPFAWIVIMVACRKNKKLGNDIAFKLGIFMMAILALEVGAFTMKEIGRCHNRGGEIVLISSDYLPGCNVN